MKLVLVAGLAAASTTLAAPGWIKQIQEAARKMKFKKVIKHVQEKYPQQWEKFLELKEQYQHFYKDDEDLFVHFQHFRENCDLSEFFEAVSNEQHAEFKLEETCLNGFFDESQEEFRQKHLMPNAMNASEYRDNSVKKQLLDGSGNPQYWPLEIPDWIKACAPTESCGLGSIEFPWECQPAPTSFPSTNYPTDLDWSTDNNPSGKSVLVDVKDQGICGSCYSFSGISVIESLMIREGYVSNPSSWKGLSEQEVINCMDDNRARFGPFVNHGCNGGWPSNIFLYGTVREHITGADSHPYTSGNNRVVGSCFTDGWPVSYGVNSEFTNDFVPGKCFVTKMGDEEQLKKALYHHGPVAVVMDTSSREFQLYRNGILDISDCSTTSLNHAMTLVGYGEENGVKYWKVRNSWGSWWGDDGYFKIVRDGSNACGITSVATYLTTENYYE